MNSTEAIATQAARTSDAGTAPGADAELDAGNENESHFSYLRTLIEFLVLLIVAVQLFRGWVMEAYRVPSGSMALTLAGEHVDVVCRNCGYAFHCGDTPERPIGRIFCPNCDSADFDENLFTVSGDRLLVFKGAYYLRSPRRWEVIVFRNPHHANQAFIKRAIGLPGEQVELKDGEVYINGELVRKDLALQRVLAVPVHNADYVADDIAARWQPDRGVTTQWRSAQGKYRFEPTDPNSDQFDWLTYRHLRRVLGTPGETEELPITDTLGYNTQFRRVEEVSVVTDLLVRCQLAVAGSGKLAIRMTDNLDVFEVRLLPGQQLARLVINDRVEQEVPIDAAAFQTARTFEMSLIDHQVQVAVDGKLLFEPHPYQSTIIPRAPTPTRPVSIGAIGVTAEVTQLELLRDIYYTDPRKAYGNSPGQPRVWAAGQPFQLNEDEYFVLGDNSAFSDDSRLWTASPVVHRRMLIGKPMIVHLPYRVSESISGFQVPDFHRIRYIR